MVLVKKTPTQKGAAMAHTTTLVDSPASEAGALDGWSIVCSACGPVGGSSLRTLAAEWAADHSEYMERIGK